MEMKLAATSILALALAAPAVFAQTKEDRPNTTTGETKKDSTSSSDKMNTPSGSTADTATPGSASSSSSATRTDQSAAASSDRTLAKDKTMAEECVCDCSQMGATKATKSKRRVQGRSGAGDTSRRSTSTDVNAPREMDRDTSASGSTSGTASGSTGTSGSATTGSSTGSTTTGSDQARPPAPGTTTDTSKAPGTGEPSMNEPKSDPSKSNPTSPTPPK
jgi:hypothetical protein